MTNSSKKPNGTAVPIHADTKPAEKSAPAKKKRPTRDQLQQVTKGGNYVFNPETGKISSTRAPTKAAVPGAKKGAK